MTTDNTNTTRNDSLAARTDTWLQSFLVWSPGQRDIIKTVALVLMVLDHINLIFQLKQEWMFLAGRGAFPLLRYATLGFREGVIATSNVLEAQTAWLSAQSEKIDAQIDVKLTEIYLKKSLGTLQ